ncbi:hypothetical protein SDC9_200231 [bioreactor metagenome]|uniref:Uncharacterized protein n=1 Tax=bioreactor metagenome TaxID=1076179 RepID=A0A645IQF7_9ZZZZ
MHYERTGFSQAHDLFVNAVEFSIFANARDQSALLAFALYAKAHHHVGVLCGGADIGRDADAEAFDLGRQQRRRTSNGHMRAHRRQAYNIAPDNAAVQRVADDGDV